MDAGAILRRLRKSRRLNQRELARAAGLAHSTVSRIEAGRVEPSFATMVALLQSVGFSFVIVDAKGDPLYQSKYFEDARDQADRRLPGHAEAWPVTEYMDPWWGWHRIAWTMKDRAVPAVTFTLPRRRNTAIWAWADVT